MWPCRLLCCLGEATDLTEAVDVGSGVWVPISGMGADLNGFVTSSKSLQVYLFFRWGDTSPLGSHISHVLHAEALSFVPIELFDGLGDGITLHSREQVGLLLSKIKITSPS